MRVAHPLWRGFFLASALVVCRVLLGTVDIVNVYRLDRAMLVFVGAMAVGALLASLPGRFRKQRLTPVRWKRCLLAFVCGGVMAFALRMSGGVWLFSLMEGSTGAAVFAACAWVSGFIAVRAASRRFT